MILRLQHQRPDGEIDSYYLKPGRRYHIGRGSACEVRILDLKLSRKHCALECNDRGWQAVDLMSTNGCTLDGEQIVGSVPVATGSVIEAGQTKLTVAGIFDPAQEDSPSAPAAVKSAKAKGAADADADHDHTETTVPEPDFSIEQEPLPDGPHDAAAKNESAGANGWEPEPNSDALNKTDALIPHPQGANGDDSPIPGAAVLKVRKPAGDPRRPTAVFRAEDLRTDDDQDNLATRLHAPEPLKAPPAHLAPPAAAAPPAPVAPSTTPGTDTQERTFYITVLGRRVGPLTRAAARELKARELKGTLTTADLEQYPLG